MLKRTLLGLALAGFATSSVQASGYADLVPALNKALDRTCEAGSIDLRDVENSTVFPMPAELRDFEETAYCVGAAPGSLLLVAPDWRSLDLSWLGGVVTDDGGINGKHGAWSIGPDVPGLPDLQEGRRVLIAEMWGGDEPVVEEPGDPTPVTGIYFTGGGPTLASTQIVVPSVERCQEIAVEMAQLEKWTHYQCRTGPAQDLAVYGSCKTENVWAGTPPSFSEPIECSENTKPETKSEVAWTSD